MKGNVKAGLVFCHFTIFNHATGVRSPVIKPEATQCSNRLDALTKRYLDPISNCVYGLMRTAVAQCYPLQNFDWADVLMIAQISARHDVVILEDELYAAGVKTPVRYPMAANGRRITSRKFINQSLILALQSLPPRDALRLAWTILQQKPIYDGQVREAENAYRRYINDGSPPNFR